MGSVYEGRHLKLGRRAALKFLDPKFLSEGDLIIRFMREAQAAAAIGSDHIVDVYDVGETSEGLPFLVMEFLDGQDLDNLLRHERRLAQGRAVELMFQTCEGLRAAHARGIVHRDLKPGNLFLIQREGVGEWVKIVDFGIAKFRSALIGGNVKLTETGMAMGTPLYMSPEQAMGESDLDHRADVYSAGVILYELLTGVLPHKANSYNQLIVKLSTEPPTPPRRHRADISEALEAVILKAMTRDRQERFGTIADLAEALGPFRGHDTPPLPSEAPLDAKARWAAATRPAEDVASGVADKAGWDAATRPAEDPDPPAFGWQSGPAVAVNVTPPTPSPAPHRDAEPEAPQEQRPAPAPEPAQEPARQGSHIPWKVLLGSAVALGIIAGIVATLVRVDNPPPDGEVPVASQPATAPDEPPSPPVAVEEPALVTISLEGVPAEAQVFLDDLPVEGHELHLRRSPELRRVKVVVAGRPPWERLVNAEQSRQLLIELEPEPEPAPAKNDGRPVKRTHPDQGDDTPRIRTQFPGGGASE
jgi:serine/threonine-protein kinase